jgi:hypothetical protein
MAKIKAYTTHYESRRMRVFSLRYFILFTVCFTLFSEMRMLAQEEQEYDEILVFLEVPNLGGGEISAVIKGEEVYLPVTDLFDFLKIRNIPSPGLDTISGYFISEDVPFRIDRGKNIIQYGGKSFDLSPDDLIRTESNLYLKGDYYGEIFGLECEFNFRNLSVRINTRLELPVIREMRLEAMRQNMTRLKGETKADTTISRSYPGFRFGMADWSAIATEQINGLSETRLNLALGSIIAGGEATVSLHYNTSDPFTEKQQRYLWRYVNNDNKALRQVMAGKIATRATSTIYNPVVGVQLTNTPTTFRRSFGSYTLTDHTEPGWIVELYVNNNLVDYAKADASGFFSFEVPLVYGNSLVRLKFYGPWGEERTREQYINIPFNFIPKNTVEYTISGGMVEDTLHSRFARTSVNYGLTRGITLGTGFEYLSSVSSGPMMPYVNTSFKLATNLLLSGEYTHTVRSKGTLSYRTFSNIQFDLNYTKFAKDQKAINLNYLEERKAVVAIPLRMKHFSLYNRFSANQLVLPLTNYTTGEWMLSGSFLGVNTNLTSYILYLGNSDPYVYSNIGVSVRLPSDFTINPQAQYGYTDKKFISTKLGLEKRFMKHGYLNLSYEHNFRNNMHLGEIGVRYDFKFAQTGASVRQTDNITTFIQYASGSLINDRRQTGYLGADNRTNVGRGGISIVPFLDVNSNNKRDPGEPKVHGLNIRASGGNIERSEKDTIIRVLGLEPYTDCFIEFDENGFDNFAWKLKNKTMNIAVDPNMLKLIELPVTVLAEASGSVMIDRNGTLTGLARVIVNFYNNTQALTTRVLTEEDGYYSYFGLQPGKYNVQIDKAQLQKLGMISSPDSISFDITASQEGDFVDGLDFIVRMKYPDTTVAKVDTVETSEIRRDTSYLIVHEVTEEVLTIGEDSYAIQIGAFNRKDYAEGYRRKIEALTGKKSEIKFEDGFYKVRIMDLKDRKEVDENLALLKNYGVTQAWVIKLTAKKQQVIITEKQDTITRISETAQDLLPVVIFPELKGDFKDRTEAQNALRRLNSKFGSRLIIVFEDGFYKLRTNDDPLLQRPVIDVMKKHEPSIGRLDVKDTWQIPVITLPVEEEEPAPVITRITLDKAEITKEFPVLAKPVTDTGMISKEPVIVLAHPEPTISLQAGVFRKKAEALKAQRRITKKLNLPVEVVLEYDYYKVIVTGFYTREETYRYYPELTQLGYPNIYLIEKRK